MYKYLIFDIEAIEHLKIGGFNRDETNESANTYITGSTLRGALIWKWLQKFGEPLPKEWVNGTMKVYNAYPLYNGKMGLPMPACFGGDKKEMKSEIEVLKLENFLTEGKKENQLPYRFKEYLVLEGNKAEVYNTRMVDRLHINKKIKSNTEDMKMFRYEAIAKGEKFRSAIQVTSAYSQKIKALLEKEQFYIGGARGGGYGRCAISHVVEANSLEAYYGQGLKGTKEEVKVPEKIYIYFVSDTILYYEGTVCSTIPPSVIQQQLGLSSEPILVNHQITLTTATTFNGMYKTNTIHYSAVAKGSLLVYEVVGALPSETAIQTLEETGIGLRREDGLGMIQVLTSMPTHIHLTKKEQNQEVDIEFNDLSLEEKKEVEYIAKSVYHTRRGERIHELIVKAYQSNRNLPKTQLGKVSNLLEGRHDLDIKKRLKAYLAHMKDKKGKHAWHKLAGVKLSLEGKRSTLQALLEDFANGSKDNEVLEEVIRKIQPVTIGQITYPSQTNRVEKEMSKKLFIAKYLHLLIRLKGERL